jgi:hypothetical protein
MLRVGDAIWIGGGEGLEPEWLSGESGYEGTLRRFLAGPAAGWAVVELDDAISVAGVTGRWLMLSLCHHDATWGAKGTVNVILSAAEPRTMVTRKGPGIEWVESRARYRRL